MKKGVFLLSFLFKNKWDQPVGPIVPNVLIFEFLSQVLCSDSLNAKWRNFNGYRKYHLAYNRNIYALMPFTRLYGLCGKFSEKYKVGISCSMQILSFIILTTPKIIDNVEKEKSVETELLPVRSSTIIPRSIQIQGRCMMDACWNHTSELIVLTMKTITSCRTSHCGTKSCRWCVWNNQNTSDVYYLKLLSRAVF